MSFASLGLSEALAGAVEAAGYAQPTPVQQRAIPAVLQGRDLMVAAWPGLFCAGEMLDWEAPTGGYLLTACLASGVRAARGVQRYLGAAA